MNHLKKIAVAAALLGSAATQATAQEFFNRSWYIMPSINQMDSDSDFGIGKRGKGGGLRFGTPLSGNWDLQLGMTTSRAKESDLRYQQDTLGADWLYMFSREPFRPFLLVGVGAQRDKISRPFASSNKTSPYIAGGVGFQYDFADQWGLQLDYRRVHGRLRDNAFGLERSDNDYVTLGLTYRFGSSPRRYQNVSQAAAVQPSEPVPVYSPPQSTTPPAPMVVSAPPPPAPPRFERYVLNATELFEFDRSDLEMPQPKLDEIAVALNNNPQVTNVVVSGHTDRLGSEPYNMSLSNRRADVVKAYLVSKGIASSRLSAQGHGETMPVVECQQSNRVALIKCLEPNRRVEVEQISFERRVQ